jgi:hypothetical protein
MTSDPKMAAKANQFIQDDDGEDGPPNQATELLDAILEISPDLFQSQDGAAYISFTDDGHYKTMALSDTRLKAWIRKSAFEVFRKVVNTNVINEVQAYLESFALTKGKHCDVFVRLAHIGDRSFLDLGSDDFLVVEITARGWDIIQCPRGVKFRRPKGMRPLPSPQSGGDLGELRKFINVSDEEWPLLLGWLIAAFEPYGACLILLMIGSQGSAKTSGCEVLKNLIDPGAAGMRAVPSNERDLSIAGKNSMVLGYDNVSRIHPWLSDALCRVSTGAGNAVRQLYKDDDEVFFEFRRPLILNGIVEFATSPDLIDRAVLIEPPYLPKEKRRDRNTFLEEFEVARPRLLGAILDAVSCAIGGLDDVHLKEAPRMADAARWVTAAEPVLPMALGSFLNAYENNRKGAVESALDFSKEGQAIVTLMENRTMWLGNSADLLSEIAPELLNETDRQRAGWPKTPKALNSVLRKVAPTLESRGLMIRFGISEGNRKRLIRITSSTVPTVPTANSAARRSDGSDGRAGGSSSYEGRVAIPDVMPKS